MGTTGFVARAIGEKNEREIRLVFGRSLFIAILLGFILLFLQYPTITLARSLFGAGDGVEAVTSSYIAHRIPGAPATLGLYVVLGTLVGMGAGGKILMIQLFLNGTNALLDLLFAGFLGMGAAGVGLGTAISSWLVFLSSLYILYRMIHARSPASPDPISFQEFINLPALIRIIQVNSDIMIRTLLLISGFIVFTDQSARLGDTTLAANHILLQFVSFSAFFLDGFAFVAESLTGQAAGSRNLKLFKKTVLYTAELSAIFSILLSLLFYIAGPFFVARIASMPGVFFVATELLPFATIYILFSFGAFVLDGVFTGTLQSRDMRNSSILSLILFLVLVFWFPTINDNQATHLWISFILFVITRAATLGFRFRVLIGTLFGEEARR